MIKVYTFGPAFAQADPSPFVVKTLTLLKMSGLDHTVEIADVRKAPKAKLPYIEDGGRLIADSSFIKMHLEEAHGVDFSGSYSERDLAIGWALEKMLEDHLYWIVVNARWMDDENFKAGPRMFFDKMPAPLRPLIIWMVRKEVRRNLWGHGLGRHSAEELQKLAEKDFAAIANILVDKPYLLGDRPCGFDATCYGFVSAALVPMFDHPTVAPAKRYPNLTAYCQRMRAQFFPELAERAAA